MAKTRITERDVCAALADACRALGLPCAYKSDGNPISPYTDALELRGDDGMGAHIIDYQPHYGGVRVQRYPGDGGGGHCRASGYLGDVPSGMGARRSLRQVRADLLEVASNAWRARSEATPGDLEAMADWSA